MNRIGITGGIGSGKTYVCKIFEILGIPVFYADSEAKRLMEYDPEMRESIIALLGSDAYAGNKLNRAFIASRVFEQEDMLEKLNRIVHPQVRKAFLSWSENITDKPYVIEEAAILFESGASKFMDKTVLVYAPEEIRVRRVMERDHVGEEAVRNRMQNQMDEEKKRQLADYIIVNDNVNLLIPQVIELHNKFLKRINR